MRVVHYCCVVGVGRSHVIDVTVGVATPTPCCLCAVIDFGIFASHRRATPAGEGEGRRRGSYFAFPMSCCDCAVLQAIRMSRRLML